MCDWTSFTFGVKLNRYSDLEGSVLLTVIHKSGGSFTFSGISSRFRRTRSESKPLAVLRA